jgi:hypothetical protein
VVPAEEVPVVTGGEDLAECQDHISTSL